MNDEGLELLKAIVEKPPMVTNWDEFLICFFCECGEGKPHARDCLWARARAYLRDQGVELKADE